MKRKTSIFFLLAWNDYRIVQGISRYAQQTNWQMDTRHFFLNQFPQDRLFKGMIAMWHSDPAINNYVLETAKSVPTVIIGTQNPGVSAPMVMPDNWNAGRLAAQHLYDLFHKNYGWFACGECPSGKERKAAFEGRLQELNFSCTDISCGSEPFDAKTVIRKLRKLPKPIGVMARDDHDAAVLLDLCHQAKFKTPEEIAIIGVGDLESLCAFSPLPISSVSLNMEEIGFQAAVALDQLMRGKSVPPETIIPAGPLIRRLSTASFGLTQPHLKAAVRIIDTQFRKPLTMDLIAENAGVSRRQLYNLFLSEMRCSPCEYLLTIRLNHARQLIATNELNYTEIAQRCGLNDRRALDRVFRRHFNVSPKKWRLSQ